MSILDVVPPGAESGDQLQLLVSGTVAAMTAAAFFLIATLFKGSTDPRLKALVVVIGSIFWAALAVAMITLHLRGEM